MALSFFVLRSYVLCCVVSCYNVLFFEFGGILLCCVVSCVYCVCACESVCGLCSQHRRQCASMLVICGFVMDMCMNEYVVHTLSVTIDAVMTQFQTHEHEL